MKIIVCGGRDYKDLPTLYTVLDQIHAENKLTCLVNGGYRGADKLASRWAEQRGVPFQEVHANWEKYGKDAGPKRNAQMLKLHPDTTALIAFPGGDGTADMTAKAIAAKKQVVTVRVVEKEIQLELILAGVDSLFQKPFVFGNRSLKCP
jgi:predicted polyphosphate/ATP-dependent NAD kinase